MNQLRFPEKSLGNLDAQVAANVLAVAADITLVIDNSGIIKDLAFADKELSQEGCENWLGQSWMEIVTVESRPKVEALLKEAAPQKAPKGRQINHPSARGADLPVLYSAVPLGKKGNIVAVGRNLRSMANLQQRLVDVQQSMEQDYVRLRHMETRYRLLFQMVSEAVLIVDTNTRKIVEANPAAHRLFAEKNNRLTGKALLHNFAEESSQTIESLLATAQTNGKADEVIVCLPDQQSQLLISATLFRQEEASLFLLRVSSLTAENSHLALSGAQSQLLKIVDNIPDALVVTDPQGLILTANNAFLDLTQLATEQQIKGQALDRWLGRPGVELNVLLKNLKEHHSVKSFATILNGEYGSVAEVELSAVSVLSGDPPCLGFMIHNIGRRVNPVDRLNQTLPRSVEQLADLVGRVPLKDLVRETTDIIERLCIEAALKLTNDNRASAAEVLGLSRQGLYDKLRRYGIAEPASDSEH